MGKYRILTFDGGGLRGIIPAIIIRRLNNESRIKGWLDKTVLFAGTSTGGIIALGLAAEIPVDRIIELYRDKGREIFNDSIWDNIRDFGKIIGADYSNDALKKELKAVFGDKKLVDITKRVAITSFDLDFFNSETNQRKWKPKIFHNYPGTDSDGEMPVVSVALYTSAAPTYFPSVDGYIDGGVFANNPSMVALAQALDFRNPEDEINKIEELCLLSLGTGEEKNYIEGQNLNWGCGQWAYPIIKILMEGVSQIADFQCRHILTEKRYHRCQFDFKSEIIPLDSVKKIRRMIEIAEKWELEETIGWIEKQWS